MAILVEITKNECIIHRHLCDTDSLRFSETTCTVRCRFLLTRQMAPLCYYCTADCAVLTGFNLHLGRYLKNFVKYTEYPRRTRCSVRVGGASCQTQGKTAYNGNVHEVPDKVVAV